MEAPKTDAGKVQDLDVSERPESAATPKHSFEAGHLIITKMVQGLPPARRVIGALVFQWALPAVRRNACRDLWGADLEREGVLQHR